MPIELVIFDCDGVLVDTEAACNREVHRALASRGFPGSESEMMALLIGRSTADSIKLLSPIMEVEGLEEVIMEAELAAIGQGVEALPGVVATLARLHLPYCVASNGPAQKVRASLRAADLWDLFEGRAFSAEEVAAGKPAPDLFLHAARSMGFAPEGCLVIEDSRAGIRGAVAAGMKVCGVVGHLSEDEILVEGGLPIGEVSDLFEYL